MFVTASRSRAFLGLAALSLAALGLTALPAAAVPGTASLTVPGTSDLWLAGAPNGTPASFDDSAPGQSPVLVSGLPLAAGDSLTFTVGGSVSNVPFGSGPPPDGVNGGILSHAAGAENGISDATMPINAFAAVFLGPSRPGAPVPSGLNFSTAASQDFSSLSPGLQQVFFIGDGLTSGHVPQTFIVPTGATRLFLGSMDGYEWSNNSGQFDVKIQEAPVPEASTTVSFGLLLALGLGGVVVAAKRGKQTA